MTELASELYRRDKLLVLTGWMHVCLFAMMFVAFLIDDRTLLGINVWTKPMKFAASIVIFVWTVAWYMDYLTGPRWALRTISVGASAAMIIEIICIGGQSLRGETSHFNNDTPLNAAIFGMMGLMITVNLLLMIGMLTLVFRRCKPLPPAYLWGVRYGFMLFIFGSLVGFMLVGHGGHAIGRTEFGPDPLFGPFDRIDGKIMRTDVTLRDGGPGLPIVNFSTEGGDLRVPHAAGLHGLQLIPIVGFIISRRLRGVSDFRQVLVVSAIAAIYAGLAGLLLWRAVSGYPLAALFWTA